MRIRNGSDIECESNFVQILENVWQITWQWLDKHSGKKARAVHGNSKFIKTEKRKAGKEQSQDHADHFLCHQGNCSQMIHPGRPNSQFCILLWCFTATAWKCANTAFWTPTEDETERHKLHKWLRQNHRWCRTHRTRLQDGFKNDKSTGNSAHAWKGPS
jgi:hypothetical protein